MNSYLSGTIVANCLKRHFHIAVDTALHPSKDLAVSPFHFTAYADYRKAHPVKGAPFFRTRASLLAPRGLLRTGVTRYLSPYLRMGVFGLSSPVSEDAGATIQFKEFVLYHTLSYFDNCSRKMVFNISGLAEPFVAFMPCPIRN